MRTNLRLDRIDVALELFCERHKLLLIAFFSSIYGVGTCMLAARRALWNDELFTLYISQLPSFGEIWAALLTGGEQIPPFFHLVTRLSLNLLGVNELAIRFPQVLGFWLMSLCLFHIVAKRSSALCGFGAMLFPLVTGAYEYAHEGRPYGMVLGFAALALICWQKAAEEPRRKAFLIGLALSMAAAISSHYYAVFLLVPLGAGEAMRSIARKRFDLPIWIAFASGFIPLVLFLPLIQESIKQSSIFWAQPNWRSALQFYYSMLAPALMPIMAMLILSGFFAVSQTSTRNDRMAHAASMPSHEIVAALGFITLPFVAWTVAALFTGAMTPRYVISTIIGLSIAIAFFPRSLSSGSAIVNGSFVICLLGGFFSVQLRGLQNIAEVQSHRVRAIELLHSNGHKRLPIVASDLNTFTTLAHYAPKQIAERLVYLSDAQASLKYLKHSSVDQGILDLKPWFRLNIEEYRRFISEQKQFLVYGGTDPNWVWLHSELNHGGFRIEMEGRNKANFLFLVTSPDQSIR